MMYILIRSSDFGLRHLTPLPMCLLRRTFTSRFASCKRSRSALGFMKSGDVDFKKMRLFSSSTPFPNSMEEEKDVPFWHYLRSCHQETDQPIEGTITGEIPSWVRGCLLRVGSGLLKVGPDEYRHLFDGLALLHRFGLEAGKVTYRSRFLRSDAYRRNHKAGRIVVSEFGTRGVPDPCRSIFQRLSSLFKMEITDNDLVNFVKYSDEVYACSETNFIWQVDPQNLDSLNKVNLSDYVAVDGAIAHPHEDSDGTVYNIGSSFKFGGGKALFQIPPKSSESASAFSGGKVLCRIPSTRPLHPSYHHSFAMTDAYFVFVEQPLTLSLLRLIWAHFVAGTPAEALRFDPNTPCRFHVIRRSDSVLLDTVYLSEKPFTLFHHINAYEDQGHLVIDVCAYEDGQVIHSLYVDSLRSLAHSVKDGLVPFQTKAHRYVLPLKPMADKEGGGNLVTLDNCQASARRQPDGSIVCRPELIAPENWSPELPRIHYERFNGRKYRYFYAMARNSEAPRTHLIKVDLKEGSVLSWSERHVIPSEPVFVPQPDAMQEDQGILLSSLLHQDDERRVSLLVLDARTMTEIGRSTFATQAPVPGDFHGIFTPQKT